MFKGIREKLNKKGSVPVIMPIAFGIIFLVIGIVYGLVELFA